MNDLINRKGAINAVCTVLYPDSDKMNNAKKVLKEMPSAQPEYYDYSDIEPLWKSFAEENDINLTSTAKQLKDAMWCGYRKGKADAQPELRWITFKTRPLTEEEKEEYPEWDCILDCILPDDGQAILVSINLRGHERVQYDEFYTDDGSYLDSGYEIGSEATAWMPLPEPYRMEGTE